MTDADDDSELLLEYALLQQGPPLLPRLFWQREGWCGYCGDVHGVGRQGCASPIVQVPLAELSPARCRLREALS